MSILLHVAMVTEEGGGHAAGEGEGAGSCSWPQQEERPGTHRSTDLQSLVYIVPLGTSPKLNVHWTFKTRLNV